MLLFVLGWFCQFVVCSLQLYIRKDFGVMPFRNEASLFSCRPDLAEARKGLRTVILEISAGLP